MTTSPRVKPSFRRASFSLRCTQAGKIIGLKGKPFPSAPPMSSVPFSGCISAGCSRRFAHWKPRLLPPFLFHGIQKFFPLILWATFCAPMLGAASPILHMRFLLRVPGE